MLVDYTSRLTIFIVIFDRRSWNFLLFTMTVGGYTMTGCGELTNDQRKPYRILELCTELNTMQAK
jgi:hypothetical protein